jgi:succinate dehydrogenase / fumarate reductase cytochrome b subunit
MSATSARAPAKIPDLSLYSTTVGKKAVMAVTGTMLAGFVLFHMLGNLQVFISAERMNAYAAFLKATPALLWGTRGLVGLAALIHVVTALQLIWRSWQSRPQRYAKKRSLAATWASRTMLITGPLLACYAIYHLLHLTVGSVHSYFDPHDVYRNVIVAFSRPVVAIPYLVAMLLLLLHLKHGIWSLFQTLGLNSPRYDRALRGLSLLVALLIAGGFIAVPLAVLAGWIN